MTAARNPLGEALRHATPALAGVGLLSFTINLLMLSSPLYMMQLYDRVLPSRNGATLVALSVLLGLVLLFMGVLEVLRSRIMVRVGTGLDHTLGGRVFGAVVERGLGAGRDRSDRPLEDLTNLRQFLTGPGLFAFFDAPWVPVYLVAIALLHPLLGGVALAGGVLLFALAWASECWTRAPLERAAGSLEREAQWVESSRRSAEVFAAMGMERGARDRWAAEHTGALRDQSRASDRAGLLTASSRSLRLLLQSAMLGAGAALAIDGVVSAGAMIAGSILLGRALSPVEQAIAHWRSLVAARRAHGRLRELLAEAPDTSANVRLGRPSGRLEVEGLFAAPPGCERAVLKGVAFALAPGEALGVIGPSGAGKSTLARILAGVWTPQRGCVRLDGVSLEHWHPEERGPAIGYLPQQADLFEGSVRDNIARLDPEASDASVIEAARRAGAHELIAHLPEGYATPIGRDGARLSGGQRQRIGLARALFGRPTLVVLDEPNSGLDAAGERALATAIGDLKAAGNTVVVIAHRPSAIAAVDRLLVLDQGRVRAFGPRDEVLAATTERPGAASSKVRPLRRSAG